MPLVRRKGCGLVPLQSGKEVVLQTKPLMDPITGMWKWPVVDPKPLPKYGRCALGWAVLDKDDPTRVLARRCGATTTGASSTPTWTRT